jgi:hypothetical protein
MLTSQDEFLSEMAQMHGQTAMFWETIFTLLDEVRSLSRFLQGGGLFFLFPFGVGDLEYSVLGKVGQSEFPRIHHRHDAAGGQHESGPEVRAYASFFSSFSILSLPLI